MVGLSRYKPRCVLQCIDLTLYFGDWCGSWVKVAHEEMQAINITRDQFHGEWNYTIAPNQQP